MRGQVDSFTHERVEGWAWDPAAPNAAISVGIYDNGVKVATVTADTPREDLYMAGIGNGRHAFVWIFPGGLSPAIPHKLEVKCEPSGWQLPGFVTPLRAMVEAAPLEGNIDICDRNVITGWARDGEKPDTPVPLQIRSGEQAIATVLANLYREDLREAGIGEGRHAFQVRIPGGLTPLERHIIRVQHQHDGREIPGSPFVIERSDSFDSALEEAVTKAIDALALERDQGRVLSFLTAQTERLLEKHAVIEGMQAARVGYRESKRAGRLPGQNFANPGLRALVIDDDVPDGTRDAGSQAILSHMRGLRDLGYAVSFVAAQDQTASDSAIAALDAAGITLCQPPYYPSIEDLLKWQRDCFDLVYLHRVSNAEKYMALARHYNRRARLIYSVADLHHLRIERQAHIEKRPELVPFSRRLRLAECTAAIQANIVITHSNVEAELLRRSVPAARVHVVPWEIPIRETAAPITERHGIAFIAGFRHRPNADAAWFLLKHVMPLVWEHNPKIDLYLAGSYLPDGLRNLAPPQVQILGAVDDLQEVFDKVRLTIAPLRFGAGIKGKILNSFAAGIPCVMTPIGAEGLTLDGELASLVGDDPEELASKVAALHADLDRLERLSRSCKEFVQMRYSDIAMITTLKTAIDNS